MKVKIAEVKVEEWEVLDNLRVAENDIKRGDKVVLKISQDQEIGEVVNFREAEEEEVLGNDNDKEAMILRKANTNDLERLKELEKQKGEAARYCRECIDKLGLKMKLIDTIFSFDGERIKFVFTADGRIDFRELVKMLGRHFQKSIKMHQIGIRDEAKILGELGVCGRKLCCQKFLKELTSITADLADLQQISHRGADRISGICGRLMCCLNYEKMGYTELMEKIPKIGSKVKFEEKEGRVTGYHVLRQTLDIKIDEETIVEVELNKVKAID